MTTLPCREGNELAKIWISIYEKQDIRFHLKQINETTGELSLSLAIHCA
jgi:hypothetical protein